MHISVSFILQKRNSHLLQRNDAFRAMRYSVMHFAYLRLSIVDCSFVVAIFSNQISNKKKQIVPFFQSGQGYCHRIALSSANRDESVWEEPHRNQNNIDF